MFRVDPNGPSMFPMGPTVEIVEERIDDLREPQQQAVKSVKRGRSISFLYGADGRMHLFRRLRQARYAAKSLRTGAFQWLAFRRDEPEETSFEHDRRVKPHLVRGEILMRTLGLWR